MKNLPACLLSISRARSALFLGAALLSACGTVRAQTIYVADPNGTNGVSSYNIDGTLINPSAIPGTSYQGIALSGSTLYVTNPRNGTVNNAWIGSYTLDGTGAVASSVPSFITGGFLQAPYGLAVTSTNLYVADFNSGNVLKYSLTGSQLTSLSSGTTNPYGLAISGSTLWVSEAGFGVHTNTIYGYDLTTFSSTPTMTITTDLDLPHGLVVSGNTLYVANGGSGGAGAGSVWTFNATTGAPIAELVAGLSQPQGITFYGSSIYVTGGDGTVKAFDATSGVPVAGFTTITGLSSPNGIAISAATAVPEPSTYAAIAGFVALGLAGWRRRRVAA